VPEGLSTPPEIEPGGLSGTASPALTARSDSDESTPIKVALLALQAGPLFVLLFMVIFLWFGTDHHLFWSFGNVGNVLEQSAGVCVIALGQLLVILTRGIDLSIGSNVSLSCVVCTVVFKHSHSPLLSIGVTLLIGLLLGLVNGFLLVKGRLPHPFIATLATLSVAAGAALIIAHGSTQLGAPWIVDKLGGGRISQIPGHGSVGWFPFAAVVVIVFAFVCWVILRKLVWGRWIYAVGGSPEAAVRTGLPVNKVLISVYVMSGLSGAIGGMLFVGTANAGSPFTGVGMELNAIAAVIIGGGSFLGGRGRVINALTGALIIGVLHNGLNLIGVNPNYQQIATGIVIVLAVELDVIRAYVENRFRNLQARLT
jgi:ribose transport system permease protein